MNEATIIHIPLGNLYHNPNNPRQDIGDVTELADSIRGYGILQNLSVVAFDPVVHTGLTVTDPDNAFVVLIGNRRLEAGKEAGVATAPCVILDMPSAADQMEVMVIENLQRSDLTPVEEAFAFRQLTLDLGKSVEEVAKKTGFSKTKIRSRIKMAEMDRSKMEEAYSRGASLGDYEKLGRIKDLDLRNEVLASIGTKNFERNLAEAKSRESNIAKTEKRRNALLTFAAEIPAKTDDMAHVCYYWSHTNDPVEIPSDTDSVKYFFMQKDQSFYVYRQKTSEELFTESNKDKVSEFCKRDAAALTVIHKRMRELRENFIQNLSSAQAKKQFSEIASFVKDHFLGMIESGYNHITDKFMAERLHRFLGITLQENDQYDAMELETAVVKDPEYALLVLSYIKAEYNAGTCFTSSFEKQYGCYPPFYRVNEKLDDLYALLNALGYMTSDEEEFILNGSHELYFTDEKYQEWTKPETAEIAEEEAEPQNAEETVA